MLRWLPGLLLSWIALVAHAAERPVEWTLAGLGRPSVSLASLRGKPVVLEFWASWCEPCKRLVPEHERQAKVWGDRVAWFAVNVSESEQAAARFVAKQRMTLAVLRDPEGKAAEALGMTAMPFAVVLDADGRVVARVAGEPYPALARAVQQAVANSNKDIAEPATVGCAGAQTRQGAAMGTQVRVVVCPAQAGAAGQQAAAQAAEAGLAEFARLERLWTTWSPDSEVSRINLAAGKAPVAVSPATLALLQAALQGSKASSGLFDITFAPLGALWKFDTPPGSHTPTRLARVPSQPEVQRILALVGHHHLRLDAASGTAFLDQQGTAIHVGGIGKGAAVDHVVRQLRDAGFRDFAVQAGGDLYCAGQNGARPWRVGIAHPRNKGAVLGTLSVRDAAFSTSGDYERFAILDGQRYHHILDTRTGFPATASQSATVLVATATQAEVMTKAAFILGGEAGLRWLGEQGAQGVVVDAAGRVWRSPDLHLEGL